MKKRQGLKSEKRDVEARPTWDELFWRHRLFSIALLPKC